MYSKSFVEGEGGVPINPSPLNILENSHLLNSQCKILKKGLGHPTPLTTKNYSSDPPGKKISGSNYAVNYLSSCETKIKSNFYSFLWVSTQIPKYLNYCNFIHCFISKFLM